MHNLLNFCIFCVYLVYKTECMTIPGPHWREPKAKGNITLILVPQENSGCNDSDVIVAVKSDCKVLSQDMQILNLVVKDYQQKNKNDSNPSRNVSLTKRPSKKCSKSTTEINKVLENDIKCWNFANYFKPDQTATFVNGTKSKIETPTVNNRSESYNTSSDNQNSSINSNISSKGESRGVLKFLESLKEKADFIETSTNNYKDNLSEMNSSHKEVIDKIVKLLEVLNTSANDNEKKNEKVKNTSKLSLNSSEQDEKKLFSDLFNISLNKENDVSNNVSFSTSKVGIAEPTALSNTFLQGALNRLKKNPSSHSLSNDNDKLMKREENENSLQITYSDGEDSALTMDEEDKFDNSASNMKEVSNNDANLNTVISNYTTSMCLPFFIDFNSTEIGSIKSIKPITINYSSTENVIQLASSEETLSSVSSSQNPGNMGSINNTNNVSEETLSSESSLQNPGDMGSINNSNNVSEETLSFESSSQNPGEMGSINNTNNVSEETLSSESSSQNPGDMGSINNSNNVSTIESIIVKSQSNNEKVELTSSLDQNEENTNFENQWLLSVEKLHPEDVDIPNKEPICTTIIVKCVPVQQNEVFEEISKIVNSPTTVTESSEIMNTVGDIEPGVRSTPTVLTECFPVTGGYIDVPVTNAAFVRKITLEPPVECASHSNVRGKQAFDIILE